VTTHLILEISFIGGGSQSTYKKTTELLLGTNKLFYIKCVLSVPYHRWAEITEAATALLVFKLYYRNSAA